MKNLLLVLSTLCLFPFSSHAQTDAKAWQKNAPWKTVTETSEPPEEVWTNPEEYKRGTGQTLRVELQSGLAAVWLDPEKWEYVKPETQLSPEMEAIEFMPKFTDSEVQAYLIAKDYGFEVQPALVRNMGYGGAVGMVTMGSDNVEVREEYRTVNGGLVYRWLTRSKESGNTIITDSYYHCTGSHVLTLTLISEAKTLEKYGADMESFLNGFVVLD